MTTEWVWVRVVDVVEHRGSGPPWRARLQVGQVRMPGGAVMLATAIVGERAIYVLPPHTVAHIMAALREGLRRT